jgi:hypothetical protein
MIMKSIVYYYMHEIPNSMNKDFLTFWSSIDEYGSTNEKKFRISVRIFFQLFKKLMEAFSFASFHVIDSLKLSRDICLF